MVGRLVLVVGGQKSGKSSWAAARARSQPAAVRVITPAVVRDEEFATRVRRHRADRPESWHTIETFDLPQALAEAGPDTFVIVDAVDTWLTETLLQWGFDLDGAPSADARLAAEERLSACVDEFLTAVRRRPATTLVIAGQPGMGVHAGDPGARAWVDLHGVVVQAISAAADEAVLVVAGRAIDLSPGVR